MGRRWQKVSSIQYRVKLGNEGDQISTSSVYQSNDTYINQPVFSLSNFEWLETMGTSWDTLITPKFKTIQGRIFRFWYTCKYLSGKSPLDRWCRIFLETFLMNKKVKIHWSWGTWGYYWTTKLTISGQFLWYCFLSKKLFDACEIGVSCPWGP